MISNLLERFISKDIAHKIHVVRFVFFLILFATLIGFAIIKAFFPALPLFPEQHLSVFREEWQNDSLPFVMSPLVLFVTPNHLCSIESYGAIGDGITLNTQAFTRAIEDCSNQGGGRVIVPPGTFLTGAIHLKSNIRLDISEGAELLFSQHFDDYLPVVFSRYEGMEYYNYSPFIYANDCHDIAITGKGSINGQGQAWWTWKSWQQGGAKKLYAMASAGIPPEERVFGNEKDGLRPSLIEFVHCERVLVEDVTLRNGPMWTLHPLYSNDILIRNITIETEGPNNDGIVIDSSRNVLVENTNLNTGDDAIVIKSGVDDDGRRVGIPSQDIVIKNCRVGHGNGGVVIGSEMSGDVRNVFVSHCTFDGTKRGFRIKSALGRGGIVENIWAEDIVMNNISAEALFVNMFYDSKNVVRPTTMDPPIIRNLFFKNISCSGANDAIVIVGAENSSPQNLSFENMDFQSKNAIILHNVDGIRIGNFNIQAKSAPLIFANNVKNAHFAYPTTPSRLRPLVRIEGSQSGDIHLEDTYPKNSIRFGGNASKTAVLRDNQ